MIGNWVDAGTVERTLQEEATRISAQLGHKMTGWVAVPANQGVFMSRCVVCCDAVTVAVRKLRISPIAGPAVQLRCSSRRR